MRIVQFIFSVIVISLLTATQASAISLFDKKPIDPPGRVARLSFTQGEVSFSPAAAKNNVWVVGRINRPLVTGDRIWVDTKSRAELQLGNAALRIDDKTSLRIMNLNDQIAQFDLSQGTLILHVREIKSGQVYEIDTPQLAFRVSQKGDYRIDVADNGAATIVIVRKGEGFAYGKNAAFKISAPHAYRFTGKNLQAQNVVLRGLDSFDKWSIARDTRSIRSPSTRYVSTTVIGYEDLDNYGSWRHTTEYGYVWTPRRVSADWAPYRYGHWSFIQPWGWTWIDDQPWGFAPSHYGRWAHYRNSWVWIPGSRTVQASYAPALVVFIGGGHHQGIVVNSSPGIAWFPLGPRDVYVPPYAVSQNYFTNINIGNTTINQVTIVNVYNKRIIQNNYTNYQINNAITAVPTKTFSSSESTGKAAIPLTPVVASQAPITETVTVTPPAPSVTGSEPTTSKPSESTMERVPVVVAPPASTGPVEQVTPPAEVTQTPTAPAEGSSVTGTYNGGDSADQAAADAKAKADKEAADKAAADQAAADAKAKADKEAADKAAADQATADAKAKSDKESADKAAADQVAADAKAKADKEAAETATADQAAADTKAKADKEAADKAAAEKAAAESKEKSDEEAALKAEADKAAAEAKSKADQDAANNAAAEKAAAEKAEAERQTADKVEADKAAAAAQAEAQRQAAEKAEADKANAAAQEDAKRQAAEQAQAEKEAAAAAEEAKRQSAEKAEADRQAAEAAAAARAEHEAAQREEAERAAAAKAEAESRAAERRAEAERAAAEREAAAQRAEAERAAADRAAAERQAAEEARAKADAERQAAEAAKAAAPAEAPAEASASE